MSLDAWEVVKKTWVNSLTPLGWVSVSPSETLTLLGEGGVGSLLVEASEPFLTPEVVHAASEAGVSVVAVVTAPSGDELAESLGVAVRVRHPDDLIRLVTGEHVTLAAGEPDSPTGMSIGVWGATGAPGRTTVATSVASLFAARGMKTLVIDADSRSGAIAPALGLLDEVPGFVAACRLVDRGQLTSDDLRRLAHRYQAAGHSFDVLTGVTSGRLHPEVNADTVTDVLSNCLRMWEVVVVDAGSDCAPVDRAPTPAEVVATTVVSVSDAVLAVVAATPVGVARFSRAFPDVTARRVGKPVKVLLNGVDMSRRSLADEATLREALRRFADVNVADVIPREASGCRQAEMSGVSVADATPQSPMVKALAGVVAGWAKHPGVTQSSSGGFSPGRQRQQTPSAQGQGILDRVRILLRGRFALR